MFATPNDTSNSAASLGPKANGQGTIDENGLEYMNKVETIRPRVRTGVDFDDYFVNIAP